MPSGRNSSPEMLSKSASSCTGLHVDCTRFQRVGWRLVLGEGTTFGRICGTPPVSLLQLCELRLKFGQDLQHLGPQPLHCCY